MPQHQRIVGCVPSHLEQLQLRSLFSRTASRQNLCLTLPELLLSWSSCSPSQSRVYCPKLQIGSSTVSLHTPLHSSSITSISRFRRSDYLLQLLVNWFPWKPGVICLQRVSSDTKKPRAGRRGWRQRNGERVRKSDTTQWSIKNSFSPRCHTFILAAPPVPSCCCVRHIHIFWVMCWEPQTS